jgi:hypothetical protein
MKDQATFRPVPFRVYSIPGLGSSTADGWS